MNWTKKEQLGFTLIFVIAALAMLALLLQPAIPQDPDYHRFADSRTLFSIPNFVDVISNLPFLLVGLIGLYKLLRSKTLSISTDVKSAYIIFFTGISLVSLGSMYYHLWPDNQSLVWDRLPMTMVFMALFTIVVSEFVSVAVGKVMLWPTVLLGLFSVVYWYVTELNGQGDLRLYAFVQFFPILAMPVIFVCFKSAYGGVRGYVWLLLAYAVAKGLEYFDAEIFDLLGIMSGHSLKHVVVAVGLYILMLAYEQRRQH